VSGVGSQILPKATGFFEGNKILSGVVRPVSRPPDYFSPARHVLLFISERHVFHKLRHCDHRRPSLQRLWPARNCGHMGEHDDFILCPF
jgi:hypothetical protein